MLGTKLILNYVKAHPGVKKSFFTHSPSILFSVFQDLETTAQGMNQLESRTTLTTTPFLYRDLEKMSQFRKLETSSSRLASLR